MIVLCEIDRKERLLLQKRFVKNGGEDVARKCALNRIERVEKGLFDMERK